MPFIVFFSLVTGAFFTLLAILLGALGAHALLPYLGEKVAIWHTATLYQMIHGLGLILIGIWGGAFRVSPLLMIAIVLMSLGIIFFSGSLYFISLFSLANPLGSFGFITPLGGLLSL